MATLTGSQKPDFIYALFIPDKTDFAAFILCLPIVYFFQVVIFEQQFDSYFDSLGGFSFFSIMTMCYFSYWAWRFGYSSLNQAVESHKKIINAHKTSGIVYTFKFFGLWLSLIFLIVSVKMPNGVF